VYSAVIQFFKYNWMTPNFNYRLLILIPKGVGADHVENFTPIALSNLAIKVYVKKALDTLKWDFITQILYQFMGQVRVVQFANISIFVNTAKLLAFSPALEELDKGFQYPLFSSVLQKFLTMPLLYSQSSKI